MDRKLLTLFSLKWNPFSMEVPVAAIYRTPATDSFCWRIENVLIKEGGFGLISGDPGTGKSVCLRVLSNVLSQIPELSVAVLTHPTSNLGDFYREMGEAFGVNLRPTNRWSGFKNLRERWISHLESTLLRPVLLIDEAQEMHNSVLNELRILSSMHFDSKLILTVVFAGDNRLVNKLDQPDLLPLQSRIRVRLHQGPANREDLHLCLAHAMGEAGNINLMTRELSEAIVDHSAGNYRAMMTLANELLMEGARQEKDHLDEKLFFEIFGATRKKASS